MKSGLINTGERSAVDSKSGEPVTQSGPGLRRPTTAATAGRNPEARPSPSQPKTGWGAGQSPAIEFRREALESSLTQSVECEAVALDASSPDYLDEQSIQQLISFFETLDRWDREANAN